MISCQRCPGQRGGSQERHANAVPPLATSDVSGLESQRMSASPAIRVQPCPPRSRCECVHALLLAGCLSIGFVQAPGVAGASTPEDAREAALRAVEFLTEKVAHHGGYVWRYSHDLAVCEGEGVVDADTIWVQPPGTPTVGEAFVRLYEVTGESTFRDAALATAEALRQGQMRSGGWQASIEFGADRRRWAYRTAPEQPKQKDQSSLDDDKTQSAMRFLIRLDRALQFRNPGVHETVVFALTGLMEKGQMPHGGFPQVWTSTPSASGDPDGVANYPETWSRAYPGQQEYWTQATLNDGLMPDVLETLFLAEEVYQEPRYRAAALRAADFLVRAQMPAPQPAWAQQYNAALQPIWARKFEPPAITGGESQGVIATLLEVFRHTGEPKYLEPIPRALAYLEASTLPSGQLARFYELQTNTPLYFTRDYQLTDDDSDLPTHYSFVVPSRVASLKREYERLLQLSPDERRASLAPPKPRRVSETQARKIIDAQDARGAWITSEGLRYHDHAGPVIDMKETVANLRTLADYLDTVAR